MRTSAWIGAWLLWISACHASPPTSADSGPLLLHVAGATVTGVFHDERGGIDGVPQFDCTFLLRGTLRGDEADIVTWYPGTPIEAPIKGHLWMGSGGVRLQLAEEPGGCAMTDGDMTREPYDTGVTTDADWIGVSLIAADRAPLRAAPGAPPPARPYLVRGDAVAILRRRGGWVRVRYLQTPVEGWLRAGEVAPDAPPP